MMWQRASLASIATVFNGKTPSKDDQRSSGHPVLKIRDVTSQERFCGLFQSFVDLEYSIKFQEKFLKGGDILVLNAAHNADYVASKMYRVENSVLGALPTGEWLVIRPNLDLVDPSFIWNWLQDIGTKQQLRDIVKGIHLYPKDVGRLEVFVPPLAEQKRIAAILDKADAIRRKRQEAIKLTEDLLHSAFLEMVGPGACGYSTWPVKRIEELAARSQNAMHTGPFGSDLLHSEFVDEGIAVLGIDNAVQNRFAWDERRYITEEKYDGLKRYTVLPNDVIVTIMGTTGRSSVVPEDIPLAITTKHLASITLDRDLAEPEFISQAVHRHPEVLAQIQKANRGAIMSGLNLGLIKALELRVPPLEVQRRFALYTKEVRRHEVLMSTALADAELLFSSLVNRAFWGELTKVKAERLVPAQAAMVR